MEIISWIVMGIIVGSLAKWIMPGKDPDGLIVTMLVGIAGAFAGGFIVSVGEIGATGDFNLVSVAAATGGALLLLFVYRIIQK